MPYLPIKAIEFHENGQIRKIEFADGATIHEGDTYTFVVNHNKWMNDARAKAKEGVKETDAKVTAKKVSNG